MARRAESLVIYCSLDRRAESCRCHAGLSGFVACRVKQQIFKKLVKVKVRSDLAEAQLEVIVGIVSAVYTDRAAFVL
jgi:hypothetical protein